MQTVVLLGGRLHIRTLSVPSYRASMIALKVVLGRIARSAFARSRK
jgi:hypothetical protein